VGVQSPRTHTLSRTRPFSLTDAILRHSLTQTLSLTHSLSLSVSLSPLSLSLCLSLPPFLIPHTRPRQSIVPILGVVKLPILQSLFDHATSLNTRCVRQLASSMDLKSSTGAQALPEEGGSVDRSKAYLLRLRPKDGPTLRDLRLLFPLAVCCVCVCQRMCVCTCVSVCVCVRV